jgi:ribosomal protein L35
MPRQPKTKVKPKSFGSASKRIKVTKGGSKQEGKLQVKVINRTHRMIKKSRSKVLEGKRNSTLSSVHDKYRDVL